MGGTLAAVERERQPTQQAPRKLTLSLLENAYDSLNDSLENADYAEAAADQARKWKLAIFLLVHALELLMKERLRREHQLLVFSSVDKRGHTVSMEVALGRLQAVGVAIEPADQAAIRTAIGWRDKIAHYEVDLSLDDANKVYAGLFEFAHAFHRRGARRRPARPHQGGELLEGGHPHGGLPGGVRLL
jgi:hypothetical protein